MLNACFCIIKEIVTGKYTITLKMPDKYYIVELQLLALYYVCSLIFHAFLSSAYFQLRHMRLIPVHTIPVSGNGKLSGSYPMTIYKFGSIQFSATLMSDPCSNILLTK